MHTIRSSLQFAQRELVTASGSVIVDSDTFAFPDVQGPQHPLMRPSAAKANTYAGHAEPITMSDIVFKQSCDTFNQFGYCADPSTIGGYLGDFGKARAMEGKSISDKIDPMFKKKRDPANKGNPWAPFIGENFDTTGLAPDKREEVEKDRDEHRTPHQRIKAQQRKEREERRKAEHPPPPSAGTTDLSSVRVSADPNNALGVVIEPVKRETPAFLRDLQAQVDAEGAAGQKHGRREDGAEVGSEEDSSSAGARGKLPRIAPESGKRTLTSADLLFGASEDTTEEREGAAAAAAGKEEVEGKGEAEGEEEDEREEGGKPSQEAGKDEEKKPRGVASSDHAAGAVEPDDVARGQQKDTTTLADEEELRLGEEEGARGPITVISGRHGRMAPPPPETTTFHGAAERDYQGRTYLDPPSDKKNIEHRCFLPKKYLHTWAGHTGAVSAIRFFPQYGHILLSSSLDGQLKIWDVYTHGKVLRTMYTYGSQGKPLGIRDICFVCTSRASNQGQTFLSCGYDRFIRQWDTETGQCIARVSNGTLPYCVKYYPENNNVFIAGCNDRRIIQWDLRSKHIVQRYDQHLGPINTVTFLDNNRRFISSSDDKALRVWEWGIPVTVKLIAEPHMHSIPSMTMHPSGKFLLGQSMDNQIVVYGTQDRVRLHKQKRFLGHICAGYAIQVSCSPDGKFVISGDSDGHLWIWDWKTHKMLKKIKVHDKVTITCAWHPIEPSRVATGSWDGTIKYWD